MKVNKTKAFLFRQSNLGKVSKMKVLSRLSIVVVALLFTISSSNKAEALSKFQQRNADRIAEITAKNWDKYGVLPSCAVGQAMQESSLGVHAPSYNYWGVNKGKTYCGSLEAGVLTYLKCINNGYYKGAPFKTNYAEQIDRIGKAYCGPGYASLVKSHIRRYNFTKYDRKMFAAIKKAKQELIRKKKLKAKRRKERLKRKKEAQELKKLRDGEFLIMYDSSLPESQIGVSDELKLDEVTLTPTSNEWDDRNGLMDTHEVVSSSQITDFSENEVLHEVGYNLYNNNNVKVVYSSNPYCRDHVVTCTLSNINGGL